MRTAGYIRVSTRQQKEDGSHDNQREQLQEWADRNGHEIDFYEDIAISGQSDERPDYEEMMEKAEQYDAIVVREMSRFGRNLRKVLDDVEHLDELGVDFITLSGEFDTSTAQGKLLLQVKGAFDEFWANLARERAQEMIERRREQGKPIGRPTKLTDEQIEEVREWNEKGLGYSAIATLVEDAHGVEVSRQTIYRYCQTDSEEAAE